MTDSGVLHFRPEQHFLQNGLCGLIHWILQTEGVKQVAVVEQWVTRLCVMPTFYSAFGPASCSLLWEAVADDLNATQRGALDLPLLLWVFGGGFFFFSFVSGSFR